MTAWIPGRNNVAIINEYTIIKASPSDFGLQDDKNNIPSHIPDFINLPSCSQEGAQPKSIRPQEGATQTSIQTPEGAQLKSIMSQERSTLHNSQNQKLCSISPVLENSKNSNPACFSEPSSLQDIEDPYWYDPDTQDEDNNTNTLLTLPDDIPYLRRSIRNLRYHQPIDAKVLKTTSGISVKQALLINEKKTISAIMDEIKNMLDYKVGHYIKYEDISQSNKNEKYPTIIYVY
jgi:hypothetical protein